MKSNHGHELAERKGYAISDQGKKIIFRAWETNKLDCSGGGCVEEQGMGSVRREAGGNQRHRRPWRLGDGVTKTLPKEDDLGSCAECIGVGRP